MAFCGPADTTVHDSIALLQIFNVSALHTTCKKLQKCKKIRGEKKVDIPNNKSKHT